MKRLSHSLGKEHASVEYPQIRLGLQPFRYQDQNKKFYIGFEDPLGLSDEFILIPQDLYFVLQFFDGEHSLSDIASEYMRRFNNF